MRSGLVAVVGRPNVGKSTLVNAMVGTKVGIVTPKPQTTRHRLYGVVNKPECQIVLIDTPGLHLGGRRALNRTMNEAAAGALSDVDTILWVIDCRKWTTEDNHVLKRLEHASAPVGVALNKIDTIADKSRLLEIIDRLSQKREFAFIVPLSAHKHQNLQALLSELQQRMPEGPALYPEGQNVGHSTEFSVAELVRERLIHALGEELPYALTVETESMERVGGLLKISALIWVEREGQKKIVIGEGGVLLKRVGSAVRHALEASTGLRVNLELWVRVKKNWSDDPSALKRFGYDAES